MQSQRTSHYVHPRCLSFIARLRAGDRTPTRPRPRLGARPSRWSGTTPRPSRSRVREATGTEWLTVRLVHLRRSTRLLAVLPSRRMPPHATTPAWSCPPTRRTTTTSATRIFQTSFTYGCERVAARCNPASSLRCSSRKLRSWSRIRTDTAEPAKRRSSSRRASKGSSRESEKAPPTTSRSRCSMPSNRLNSNTRA